MRRHASPTLVIRIRRRIGCVRLRSLRGVLRREELAGGEIFARSAERLPDEGDHEDAAEENHHLRHAGIDAAGAAAKRHHDDCQKNGPCARDGRPDAHAR